MIYQRVGDFDVIDKKRMFDLLHTYFKHAEGHVLSEIRFQIANTNKIAPAELGG